MFPHHIVKARHERSASVSLANWIGLVFAALWLVACSESPQEKILGKWQVADTSDGNILEFYQDGTVSFVESITGVSINGEYAFLTDQKIKIELSGILAITGATIYAIAFSDAQMTLETQNGGSTSTYVRLD